MPISKLRKCYKDEPGNYGLRTSKLGNYKEFEKWYIEQLPKDDEGVNEGLSEGVSDGVKPGFKLPNDTKTQ